MLPTFKTERLFLRPRTMEDYDACLIMDRDPDVTRFVSGPWNDQQMHEAFLKERIETSFGPGMGYWSIFPKQQPEQFSGWILLIPYDGMGPEIEIGWRLNRAAWGKGFATEAARLIAKHALGIPEVERIVADIDPQNLSSIRVAEKIGMTFIGDGEYDGDPCKCYEMTSNSPLTAP